MIKERIMRYRLDLEKEYSVKEAADILDCSESSIRRLMKSGQLMYRRVVGMRIPGESIKELIKRRTMNA